MIPSTPLGVTTIKRGHSMNKRAPASWTVAILALAAGPLLARSLTDGESLRDTLSSQVTATVSLDENADEAPGDEDVTEAPGGQTADEDPGDQGLDENDTDQADANDNQDANDQSGDQTDQSDANDTSNSGDSGGDSSSSGGDSGD